MVDISVSGSAEELFTLYSTAGLKKMVSCGGMGPFPLLPSLWGPVRPKYFPSLIDSRDRLLAEWALTEYYFV